jgi:hypothetical protein
LKKILLLAFVLILSACTATQPQVTVTREVTVTLPPPTLTVTPTLEPTATPTITPIPTFSPEAWAALSPDQKRAAVPPSPDYIVGDVSTIEGKDNYVIVRDPNTGEATGTYNAFTGKIETMQSAGLKEFLLNDGTYWEMAYFGGVDGQPMTVADVQKVIDYMVANGANLPTEKFYSLHKQELIDYIKIYGSKLSIIKGTNTSGKAIPFKDNQSKTAFGVLVNEAGNGSLVFYWHGRFDTVYMDISAQDLLNILRSGEIGV